MNVALQIDQIYLDTKECLIPHLKATLSMNWGSPPESIREALIELGMHRPDHRFLPQVENRCGSEAVRRIKNLVRQNRKLSFATLADIQSTITPGSTEFRRTVAFTSNRPERYAYFDGLESMFDRKVRQDDLDDVYPVLKAIRLYLDIIFVHPFADGNARAAMAWITFYALKYGFSVPDFRAVFAFPFHPRNPSNYWAFVSGLLEGIIHVSR